MQSRRLARGAYTFGPIVAVVGLAIVVRATSWLNNDSSELITFAENYLDGARPYVDFREVNPPASLLVYLPDVVVGRWFSLAPEAVLTIGIFVATFVSLWLTARILRAASLLDDRDGWVLAPAALAILLILPEYVFGQREHLALIAILPMLAGFAARAAANPVSRWNALVAGIGGGIAASIKPPFALALLFPLLYAIWNLRAKRSDVRRLLLTPEILTAAFVVAAYGLIVVLVFPEYLQVMLPILRQVYAPARLPWPDLLSTQSVVLVLQAAVAIAIIGPRAFLKPFPLAFGMAAAGFLASVLIQGKGWPYHGYPAIALMLLILCVIAVRRWPEMRTSARVIPWSMCVVILVVGLYATSSVWFWPLPWYPRFVSTVAQLAPPHPKIASLCGGTQFLFPLVRIVQGSAIDDVLWVNDAAFFLRAYGEVDAGAWKVVESYARRERRAFDLAIREKHPDVVIVCPGWREWAQTQPEVSHTLSRFHNAATLEIVQIWLPNR